MSANHIVLIHGWAGVPAIMRFLAEHLSDYFDEVTVLHLPGFDQGHWPADEQALLQELLPQLPPKACYLGWSMGGNVAGLIAEHYPQRVQALILLTSNPSFVERDQTGDKWPGMPPEYFEHFQQHIREDVLKTLLEFQFLVVSGHQRKRLLLREMASASKGSQLKKGNLLESLAWLGRVDSRPALAAYTGPKLAFLGRGDALVPVEVEAHLSGLGFDVRIVDSAGHALLISHASELATKIAAYWQQARYKKHKKAVADSFSRAAKSYDSAAQLQRDICDQLLSCIDPGFKPGVILELGSGTGYALTELARLKPALLINSDIAVGMLQQIRAQRLPGQLLAQDAEAIACTSQSIDLVFSSLAVQWCQNLPALMGEISRVLKPGGRAYIATLGPDTLIELKQAWAELDDDAHVNDFASSQQLEAVATANDLLMQCERCLLQPAYEKLTTLMAELKAIGAHNVSDQRPKGLMGKKKLQRLISAYESYRRTDGLLPATYEVYYLTLTKKSLMSQP